MLKRLDKLKVGTAFVFDAKTYIALCLTPDPAEVYCLNVETKQIEEIYEGEKVEVLTNWDLEETLMPSYPRGRKNLEVMY